MCGLTGYARNPSGVRHAAVLDVFEELLHRTQHRGTHATGVAVSRRKRDPAEVTKRAVPANVFLKSDVWQATRAAVLSGGPVTVLQGHVRWATHDNAHLDAAAHPFTHGEVAGAHNGILSNWKALDAEYGADDKLIVDSQAAFVALNAERDPVTALEKLRGYFALTWTKRGMLYFARAGGAPLSAAYVPEVCALFWNSEQSVLASTLKAAGLTPRWLAELDDKTVYAFQPAHFGQRSTPTKTAFTFTETRRTTATASARPTWKDEWDPYTARMLPAIKKPATAGALTLRELLEEIETLTARVEALEEAVWDDTAEEETIDDSPQLDLLPVPADVCRLCRRGGEEGTLHDTGNGERVHLHCIMSSQSQES